MKNKVLFTAKVDSHIRHFHLPFLAEFKKNDYDVHVASFGDEIFPNCDIKYNIEFGTNPFSKKVFNTYKDLKRILKENDYSIIHSHTAIASVLTRLAARSVNKRKKNNKTKVIYTAHGFHFLKGGSLVNWVLYFPIEYFLSKITDVLILINQEDFQLANKYKMGSKRYLVPGVGVDLEKFNRNNRELTTTDENFIVTNIGELNDNKNQKLLIEAIELCVKDEEKIELNLVGDGDQFDNLQRLINEKHLNDNVKLLGYRNDVKEILNRTDLVVSTSKREGLPVNIIEAMAMGIPLIVTACRGQVDLVENNVNGYVAKYDKKDIYEKIILLKNNPNKRKKFSEDSLSKVNRYSLKTIVKQMNEIYGLKNL